MKTYKFIPNNTGKTEFGAHARSIVGHSIPDILGKAFGENKFLTHRIPHALSPRLFKRGARAQTVYFVANPHEPHRSLRRTVAVGTLEVLGF